MTHPPRDDDTRQPESERTRANILAVAREAFADKGLMGARIDEIAAKTNTSKRMIYYHFGSKVGLYQAVLEQEYRAIRDREAALSIDDRSPVEALRAHVRLTFDHHFRNPDFVRLVMNENMLRGAYIRNVDAIRDRSRDVIASLSAILDRGVAEGRFRPDLDPLDLHMTISALCFHYVANRHTFSCIFGCDMETSAATERRRDQIVEIVTGWCRRD